MADKEITVVKNVVWCINDLTKDSIEKFEVGKVIQSPSFQISIGDNITEWEFDFFPNGEILDEKSNLGFFLVLKNSSSTHFSARYHMKVIGGEEHECGPLDGEEFEKYANGSADLMHHEKLFDPASEFSTSSFITFNCMLTFTQKVSPNLKESVPKGLTLLSDLRKMLEHEIFTDFQMKTSDGEILKAHKSVLSARSPVFYAMLSNDMQEVKESSAEVPDFDSMTMKEVLRFIYCHEVEDLDDAAHDLIYAAEKYQLDGLKELCIDSLVDTLSIENVIDSLEISESVSKSWKLYDKCLKLIISKYHIIIKEKKWKQLPSDLMIKIQHDIISRCNNIIYI